MLFESTPQYISRHSSLSQSRLHDSFEQSRQVNSDSSINVLVTALKELVQTMNTGGSNERYPTLNVLPEFDRFKRNQTVDT